MSGCPIGSTLQGARLSPKFCRWKSLASLCGRGKSRACPRRALSKEAPRVGAELAAKIDNCNICEEQLGRRPRPGAREGAADRAKAVEFMRYYASRSRTDAMLFKRRAGSVKEGQNYVCYGVETNKCEELKAELEPLMMLLGVLGAKAKHIWPRLRAADSRRRADELGA